jgi:hypothetical protein
LHLTAAASRYFRVELLTSRRDRKTVSFSGGGRSVGMSPDGFIRRISSGKAVNCTYKVGELAGLISAWPHSEGFILTWEECRNGDQYNEDSYSRDERHTFGTAEEVLAFVERSGFPASEFTP